MSGGASKLLLDHLEAPDLGSECPAVLSGASPAASGSMRNQAGREPERCFAASCSGQQSATRA